MRSRGVVGARIVVEAGGVAYELRDRCERGVAGAVAPDLELDRAGVGRGGVRNLAREPRLADAGRTEHGDELRRTVRDCARERVAARAPSPRRARRTARQPRSRPSRSRPRRPRRARSAPRPSRRRAHRTRTRCGTGARSPRRRAPDPGEHAFSSRAATFSASPIRSASPSPITTSPVLIPTRNVRVSPCRSATSLSKGLEALLRLDARAHRSHRVVFGDLGNPEQRHHPVAHELGDGAAVAVDHLLQDRVIPSHHLAGELGVGPFAEARRAAEVGEHHGHGLANRIVLSWRGAGRRGARPTGVPQLSQNARSASSSASQFEQRIASAEPQPPQNRAPSRLGFPHFPHSTVPPPDCVVHCLIPGPHWARDADETRRKNRRRTMET